MGFISLLPCKKAEAAGIPRAEEVLFSQEERVLQCAAKSLRDS